VPGNDRLRLAALRPLRSWLPEGALLRQYGSLGLANVAVAATSFLSLAVVARTLSLDEFGRVIFALSATGAAFALLDPRLEDTLQRFLPIVQRDQGGSAASRLFENVLLLDQSVNVLFGALGLTLLLIGIVPVGGVADPALLAPATVQAAAQGAIGTLSAGFATTDGLARWGFLQAASTIGVTAASLAGLALGGAVGFLTAAAVAALVTTAALGLATVKRTRRVFGHPSRGRHALPPGFFSFTFRAAANSSVLIGAEALPLTIIGFRANAATLAGFRVALSPGRFAAAAISPVSSITFPRASRASAARRPAVAAREALHFSRRTAPVAGVLFCAAAIAMPTAITLVFGRYYAHFSLTATLLLAAALMRGIVAWSKTLPLAFGDATRRLMVSIVDVSGLIIAATLLCNTRYALGVAIAYASMALVISLYWISYAHRRSTAV